MKKEIADQWVAALRSGKYKQGHFCLRSSDNEYCCLGVLTDLLAPEAWSKTPNESKYSALGTPHYLPVNLMTACGMYHERAKVPFEFIDDRFPTLAELNDAGLTFSQIADLIDYFWEDL